MDGGGSSRANQQQQDQQANLPPRSAAVMDPKRMKRLLQNREYTRRYQARQKEYLNHLLNKASTLQEQKIVLSHQISLYETEIAALQTDNLAVRQKVEELEYEAFIGNAETTSLQKEKEMLISMTMPMMKQPKLEQE